MEIVEVEGGIFVLHDNVLSAQGSAQIHLCSASEWRHYALVFRTQNGMFGHFLADEVRYAATRYKTQQWTVILVAGIEYDNDNNRTFGGWKEFDNGLETSQ